MHRLIPQSRREFLRDTSCGFAPPAAEMPPGHPEPGAAAMPPLFPKPRREFLRDTFCGFGSLALAAMLHRETTRSAQVNPLAPQPPHRPDPKAKAVIFLFMAGG